MGIYLDTEFYVPHSSRTTSFKMKTNPAKDDHILLGGVFYSGDLPTTYKQSKPQKIWIWDIPDFDADNPIPAEKKLLEIIYKIFQGEIDQNNILKTIGIGISRFDLPALFTRSYVHQIQPKHKLYRAYLSGFPTDLSVAGIGYVDEHKYGFEPVSTNQLFSRYGIDYQKEPGSTVWELYDDEQYHLIERRTELEIEHIITLYRLLCDEIT